MNIIVSNFPGVVPNLMEPTHNVLYTRNRPQKKIFTDSVNLGVFANIFLYYFLHDYHFLVLITKFMNVFLRTL